MKERMSRLELLGSAPVQKALLSMGLPTMVGMMINAVYMLADAYFVGGLGTSQMGAIAVAFPLGQVIVGLALLFGNGAASYIARLLGKGDRAAAGQVASVALYGSLTVGAAVICVAMLFLPSILVALGATESILPYAIGYARIYVGTSIFNVFNVTMNNIVTSEGAAKTTMFTLLAGAALNMILDPVFIYVFGWGVAGAALATAVSQMISSAVYVAYILGKRGLFTFAPRECRVTKTAVAEIFRIGVPTLAFQLLTSLAIALVNAQAAQYGDSAIAGMGAVTRVISLGSLIVFGFIKGFQPIAGYSYGSGNYARVRLVIKTALLWTTVFCVSVGLVLSLFPAAIVSRFTRGDAAMIRAGGAALRANGLSFMLFGFCTVYSSLFLAMGKAKEGLLLGVCRQGLCFIPVILIAPSAFGIAGVLYAQPVADVLAAIVTACLLPGLYRNLDRKAREESR
jgi:putative MATE family efflux protein